MAVKPYRFPFAGSTVLAQRNALIIDAVKNQGRTQAEVARSVGLTQATVSNIIRRGVFATTTERDA